MWISHKSFNFLENDIYTRQKNVKLPSKTNIP